ncbi:hypothetical protein [Salinactinospora qingdaonensis]|uniref:DNA-directed RNA polymerase specialized sigma subunit, sigma24 family n=1 Tax=Salinactinospora qingdaonensis TaxID=702744 RepID=A0ABP7FQ95_9ACTN
MLLDVSSDQPFSALQRSVELVISGAAPPVLPMADLPGVEAEELAAGQVVTLLRRGSVEVADALWRRVLARSRAGQTVWTVVAAGAMLPRLVSACSRFGRVPNDHIADVEAEMLAALLEQMRSVDTSGTDVGSQLWHAAANTAYRCGYHAQQNRRRLTPWDPLERETPHHDGRGPVTVLAEAITQGLLTRTEADLIARTRLESQTLGQVAADLGLAYITARRRRHAAEARLAHALEEKSADAVSATTP